MNRYEEIVPFLYIENRKRLTALLEEKSLVLLFSNDKMPRNGDQFFPFRQNSNLLYLCGIDQANTILAICPEHPNPKFREILFIEESTEKTKIWEGYKYTKEHAKNSSGVNTVFWTSEFDAVLKDLTYHSQNIYLNVAESTKFSAELESKEYRCFLEIKNKYPLHQYHRLFPILRDLRLVKLMEEINQMLKACNITAKAFERVLHYVKPSVTEYEIEAEITHEFICNKVTSHAFPPIVASGENACVLHYTENNAVCQDGELLLLDFGAEYANYAADLSRTIPVNGKFSARQKQVYDACCRVFIYAKTLFVPGMSIDKVYKKVCEAMQHELIALNLFSEEDLKQQKTDYSLMKKYFMHGISHFVGLDAHDVGTTDVLFEEGMVLSCEPGIYIPEEQIGIRIETMILVAKTPIDMMIDIPVFSDDIERLMQEK